LCPFKQIFHIAAGSRSYRIKWVWERLPAAIKFYPGKTPVSEDQ
jgi:hypothetical protein